MAQGSVFRDPEKLKKLFELRRNGHSFSYIANHFGVHHSSLIYHFKKNALNITKNPRIKEDIINQVRNGKYLVDIAMNYGIPERLLDQWCYRSGIQNLIYGRRWWKAVGILGGVSNMRRVSSYAQKHRPERPGWRKNSRGEWINIGKTPKEAREEETRKKKKLLEKKRLDLLTY